MLSKLRALFSHPRMPYLCALIAIILLLPTLGTGLMMDDHAHKMLVNEGGYPGGPRGTWDLFRFLDDNPAALKEVVDKGMWPWWSVPGFRLAFFRPLASMLHTLDYRVWPNAHALMHFESVLIFALAALSAAFLYRRLLGPSVAAGLAGFMFAVDDAHAMVITWVANRHSIISTALGIAALIAHDKYRKDGWKPGLYLGPFALTMALLGGENGVSTLPYLFGYAVFLENTDWKTRFRSLVPYGIIAALWAVGYKLGGYGAAGGAFYIDPIRQVGDYLQAVGIRLPVLLAGQMAVPPADVWMSVPPEKTTNLVSVCLVVLTIVGAALTLVLRKNKTAGFFALGMTLSLLPACATWPGDRNLLFAGLGGFGLVAQLITESRDHLGKPARILVTFVSGTFIFLHLVVAPLFLPLRSQVTGAMLNGYTDRAIGSMPSGEVLKGKMLVVVNAPDSVISNTVIAAKLNARAGLPDSFRVLSTAVSGTMNLSRPDDKTLSISLTSGHMNEPTATVFRDPKRFPLRVGDRIKAAGMEAEIKALSSDGLLPERIDFHFDKALEDAQYVWIYWDKRNYAALDLPKVGEERAVAVLPYSEVLAK